LLLWLEFYSVWSSWFLQNEPICGFAFNLRHAVPVAISFAMSAQASLMAELIGKVKSFTPATSEIHLSGRE